MGLSNMPKLKVHLKERFPSNLCQLDTGIYEINTGLGMLI